MSYDSDYGNPVAMDNDITFAPSCTSTCRFTFQNASTPFNPMDPPSLGEPPVSAIKPEVFFGAESNKSSGSILSQKADNTNDTENTSNQSQTSVNKTAPNVGDATMQRRKSYANLR